MEDIRRLRIPYNDVIMKWHDKNHNGPNGSLGRKFATDNNILIF